MSLLQKKHDDKMSCFRRTGIDCCKSVIMVSFLKSSIKLSRSSVLMHTCFISTVNFNKLYHMSI
jgi:hypothetical protein